MDVREVYGMAGVPFILALVELVKRSFPGLHAEQYPMLAVLFGIVINGAIGYYLQADGFAVVLTGIMAGLAASGLYSGGKAVASN